MSEQNTKTFSTALLDLSEIHYEIEKQRDALYQALKAVEWTWIDDVDRYCELCDNTMEQGHEQSCALKAALDLVEKE